MIALFLSLSALLVMVTTIVMVPEFGPLMARPFELAACAIHRRGVSAYKAYRRWKNRPREFRKARPGVYRGRPDE